MFAKVADLTKFMFCYSIMSANRNALENSASSRPHVRLATNTSNGSKGNAAIPHMSEFPLIGRKTLVDTDLDQFFPFDPYDLPRSRVYVDKLYRHWDEVALPEMKGEEDSESSGDESSGDSDHENDDIEPAGSISSDESTTPESTRMPDRSDRPPILTGSSGARTASGRRLPAEELRSAQQISTSLEGMKLTSPPRHSRSLGIIA
jgi:RNA polymerase I-specific transcription initiation factor RRN3